MHPAVQASLTVCLVASCATTTSPQQREPAAAMPLSQFMRERVNVPFAFAMMESGNQRQHRVRKAASVLKDAVQHLVHWSNPPVVSVQGRDVFVTYAMSLEGHVLELERAAQQRDADGAAHSLEQIRQTCNHCHRFFRPANRLSPDVAYDRLAIELGVDR
jgi:cytochrome c556